MFCACIATNELGMITHFSLRVGQTHIVEGAPSRNIRGGSKGIDIVGKRRLISDLPAALSVSFSLESSVFLWIV